MNKGPWGSAPSTPRTIATRAARSTAGRFVATLLLVSVLFGGVLFGWSEYRRQEDSERMPRRAYEALVQLARTCPAVRGPIRGAMADGYLTQGEASSISRIALAREEAYDDAEARRAAAAAVGARPIPTPAKCGGVLSTVVEGFGTDFIRRG